MSEYEKVYFEKWQDLAKAVIDGREFFVKNNVCQYFRLSFDGESFNCKLEQWVENVYIKKQPTLEELIAIKPRLCWGSGWSDFREKHLVIITGMNGDYYEGADGTIWSNVKLVSYDEIKQFLNGE